MHQDHISILNIYAPKHKGIHICKFVKETLLKLKTYLNPYKLIMGDFSAQRLTIDQSYRQKLNEEILELRDKWNTPNIYLYNALCKHKSI